MKEKTKALLGVGALVVVLGLGAIAYNLLADKAPARNLIVEDTPAPTATVRPQESAQPETGAPAPSAAPVESEAPEYSVPDFVVTNVDGEDVNFWDMQGKPVVLNFWASWCGPCRSEMPGFQAAYEEFGDEVTFVMVNLTDGRSETVQSAQDYLDENGFTFPVYFDVYYSAASTYGVNSIPTTYFLNAQGEAVARAKSAISEDTLREAIDLARGISAT